MPLVIKLAPSEKIVINGVVIENGGNHSVLRILNQASLLRAKDILTLDEANSPAKRIYFALQCLYLFPENGEEYLGRANQLIAEFLAAAPSSEPLITLIKEGLKRGESYQTLKVARQLVELETRIIEHAATL